MGRKKNEAPAGRAAAAAGGPRPAAKPKPRPRQKQQQEPPELHLRVQLPYFLARIGVFAVLTVVFLLVGFGLFLSVVLGFAAAGILTWPIGRMQRRAAEQAAAAGRSGAGASKGPGGKTRG